MGGDIRHGGLYELQTNEEKAEAHEYLCKIPTFCFLWEKKWKGDCNGEEGEYGYIYRESQEGDYPAGDLKECSEIVSMMDAKMLQLNQAILEAKAKQEMD